MGPRPQNCFRLCLLKRLTAQKVRKKVQKLGHTLYCTCSKSMLSGEVRQTNSKWRCSKFSFVKRNIDKTRNCLNQLCWSSGKQLRFTAIKQTHNQEKAIFKRVGKFYCNFAHPCPTPPQHSINCGLEQVATQFLVLSLELEGEEPTLLANYYAHLFILGGF